MNEVRVALLAHTDAQRIAFVRRVVHEYGVHTGTAAVDNDVAGLHLG